MWLYLFILLLFQNFVFNETSPFFAARRFKERAEFELKKSVKLKDSETVFVHTYSNGTRINYPAYNVYRKDDDRFQFTNRSSTLSHDVKLINNTFIFNNEHIGCKVLFKMPGFVRLNFTGLVGFDVTVRFNENKHDIVTNCAFPLFHRDTHYSFQNCHLTEHFKVFSRTSKTMKKYEGVFKKILLENHFTIDLDDEIEPFRILLSFRFVFPHKPDDLFVGENTKVLIKC